MSCNETKSLVSGAVICLFLVLVVYIFEDFVVVVHVETHTSFMYGILGEYEAIVSFSTHLHTLFKKIDSSFTVTVYGILLQEFCRNRQ